MGANRSRWRLQPFDRQWHVDVQIDNVVLLRMLDARRWPAMWVRMRLSLCDCGRIIRARGLWPLLGRRERRRSPGVGYAACAPTTHRSGHNGVGGVDRGRSVRVDVTEGD